MYCVLCFVPSLVTLRQRVLLAAELPLPVVRISDAGWEEGMRTTACSDGGDSHSDGDDNRGQPRKVKIGA